jgi:hypothetical protein
VPTWASGQRYGAVAAFPLTGFHCQVRRHDVSRGTIEPLAVMSGMGGTQCQTRTVSGRRERMSPICGRVTDEAIFSFFLGGLSVERRNKLATESRFAC